MASATGSAELNTRVFNFDAAAITSRYKQERVKRLREDGREQYQQVQGDLAHLNLDTFADETITRDPEDADAEVIIVGAGYGGLLTAAGLAKQGITDVRIVEKGGSYGGTWYWNQYPGARCDIESYIYMPLLEDVDYIPKEKYSTGAEILSHISMIVSRWDLQRKILLQTEVESMSWDNSLARWIVRTKRNDTFRARFVITATGILHKPKLPGVPGISEFGGHSFHTSRWDYKYTGGSPGDNRLTNLADKRVAIIGTGATAIQVVPILGQYSKQLYLFQRTPSSVNARNNRPTDANFAKTLKPGWQRDRMENFNAILAGIPVEKDLVNDGWTEIKTMTMLGSGEEGETSDPAKLTKLVEIADLRKMDNIRARIGEIVKDKVTAEKLKPWYPSICKRPCFHDEYLQTFNQSNVTLVDTDGKGIERISAGGVVANGKEYEVDLIIYSTGFDTRAELSRGNGIAITGRNGQSLHEYWKDGVKTLYGIHVHNFPNYFIINTAQSGLAANFVYTLLIASQHIAHVISSCLDQGIQTIEPSIDSEEKWVQTILDSGKTLRDYFTNCTPGYFSNEGELGGKYAQAIPFGGGASQWSKILENWREKGTLEGMEIRKADCDVQL